MLRGDYPELRGARWGAWTLADVAVGLAGAALWIAPFLLFDSLRPGEPGFDLGQLGPGGEWFVQLLRAIGYVARDAVRGGAVRAQLAPALCGRRRDAQARSERCRSRASPGAASLIVTLWFVFSHAPFEWGVMLGWTLLTMAWFYHRKHLAPLVLVHAVTNGAIFAFVRLLRRRVPRRVGRADLAVVLPVGRIRAVEA